MSHRKKSFFNSGKKLTIIMAACASLYAFGAFSVQAEAATDGMATWERLNVSYPQVAIREALATHYEPASFPAAMLWHENEELTPRGVEALNSLSLATLGGVSQKGVNRFVQRVKAQKKSAAAADWLITARLLQLNSRLEGVNFSQFSTSDASSLHRVDPRDALAEVIAARRPRELLKLWLPDAPGFSQLADKAEAYESMLPWPGLSGEGVISVGDRDDEVVQLKRRLASEAFEPPGGFDRSGAGSSVESINSESINTESADKLFTEELATQLKKYQTQRGLTVDGVLGPNTRSSLNISPAQRAMQIRVNLARLKALPANLGDHYVWVNIPEYKARVILNDQTDFETRIVVGTKQHQTPIFIDQMDYLEVNPYWNIPRSIVIDELAPKMVRNPAHIDEKNMEVLSSWNADATVLNPRDINWQGVADGSEPLTFRVRQRPGDQNALGRVKFIFPNDHSVYLHDTPKDELFDDNKRNFSHGCIRLHKPFAMADYVLKHRRDEFTDFRAVLRSKQPSRLHLDQPLPVYLVYFTTWVDDNGELQIRNDVYGHDRQLAAELEKQRQQLLAAGEYSDVIALEDELIPNLALTAQ